MRVWAAQCKQPPFPTHTPWEESIHTFLMCAFIVPGDVYLLTCVPLCLLDLLSTAPVHSQRQVMAEETAAAAGTGEGAADGAGGSGAGQGGGGQEEEDDEDGSAAMLVPGSVPEGMLLDELEDEEAAAAAALAGGAATGAGGAGEGAGAGSGAAAGSGNRGLFVDDVPSALGAADVASLLLDDDLAEEAAKQGLNLKELASPQKPGSGLGTAAGFGGPRQQGLEVSQEGGSQTPQQALGVRFLGAAGAGVVPAAAAAAVDGPLPAAGFIGGFGAGAQLPPLPPGAAAAAAGAPATSFKRQRGMGRPPGVPGRGGRGSRGGRLGRPPGVPGRRGRGRRGRGAGAAAGAAGDGWAG